MSQFTNKVIAQADIAFEEHVAKLEQETGLALRDLSLIDMLNALKAYRKLRLNLRKIPVRFLWKNPLLRRP